MAQCKHCIQNSFQDAVAMTGGQSHEGDITALGIIKELKAIGVKKVVGVFDQKEIFDLADYAKECEMFEREKLNIVQKDLALTEGVTAIVLFKLARQKKDGGEKGEIPDPDKRIYINPKVCEDVIVG